MKGNFDKCLERVLKHEGGFVNHPDDPGGITNLGITKSVYEDWVDHEVTEECMRNLTPEDVAPIYRAQYWDLIRGKDLPAGIDYIVFDYAVNSGAGKASKALQNIVGVLVDGHIGPITLAHTQLYIDNVGYTDLVNRYQDNRLVFLQGLTHWSTFGKGWTNRVEDVRETALEINPHGEV